MSNNTSKKVHFIAIGGSVMHQLAIALHKTGFEVSGSDDGINDPSKSNLAKHGLLPENLGWEAQKINNNLDFVIVGMHAKADNPELLKAKELGLTVYSFPEYIYEHSKNKERIVIGGSHGKSSITAMIMHVLHYCKKPFDFVVGAGLKGFDQMVALSDAPIIIIEGDEYSSAPNDPTPKFLKYQHHIGVISGIAWDHYNIYNTEDEYVKQFDIFADASPKCGTLIYCEEDSMASLIGAKEREAVTALPYKTHPHIIENGISYLTDGEESYALKIFGQHNMQNISAAKEVLMRIGVTKEKFFKAIQSFEGADLRLTLLNKGSFASVYKDFAHAPSKVKASSLAIKQQYPDRDLVACIELHTFSSLNDKFIHQYKDSLSYPNEAIVYVNPKNLEKKGLPELAAEDIKKAFNRRDLKVFFNSNELKEYLCGREWQRTNLVMMSSGNFGGLDLREISDIIVK